jgi:hypothetical protein
MKDINHPEGIGIDPFSDAGLLYVADTGNSRVQVFKLENYSFIEMRKG